VALLASKLETSRLSTAGQLTSLAYPILYVSAALVMLQALLAGLRDVRRDRGMIAVLAGLALSAMGFVLWSPQLLTGTYMVGTDAVDALWSVGPILIGVGAWASRLSRASAEAGPVSGRWGGLLPALTFVVLAAVQIAANAGDGDADLALSVGLSVVGVTLIAHAAVLRRRQGTLVGQLHARDRELRDANILLDDTNRLLRKQSRTDTLTGLANRLCLSEDFINLAAQTKRHGQGFCLVLIDLDHFKDYNDDHGHQAGDVVLAQVAEILSETLRESDQAYRYGGEELLLMLRDQDLQAGLTLAERYRAQVERAALPHALNPPHRVVTLSAGVASAHRGETPEQVLHRADQALYDAKALGRNRVAVSDPATTRSHPAAVALSHT
jgi:diguanylate cyclase (GGDEF)-like protein